jgi:hypothetical protein
MSTFAMSNDLPADFLPHVDENVSAMEILANELENDAFVNDTPPFWAEDKRREFKQKLGVFFEAARSLPDVVALQLRVAELEEQVRQLENGQFERERLMKQQHEIEIWRVMEGLPRYDTWGKPTPPAPAHDDPIVYPVPDPSKY